MSLFLDATQDVLLYILGLLDLKDLNKSRTLCIPLREFISEKWDTLASKWVGKFQLKYPLYDYQLQMASMVGCSTWSIDKRLGRTLGGLLWLAQRPGHQLVITTKARINSWVRDANSLDLKSFVYHREWNKKLLVCIGDFNLIIASYTSFYKRDKTLGDVYWSSVIFDEFHKLNDKDTITYNNVGLLSANRVLFIDCGHHTKTIIKSQRALLKNITESLIINPLSIRAINTIWDLPPCNFIDLNLEMTKTEKKEYEREKDLLCKSYEKKGKLALQGISKLRRLTATSTAKIKSILGIIELGPTIVYSKILTKEDLKDTCTKVTNEDLKDTCTKVTKSDLKCTKVTKEDLKGIGTFTLIDTYRDIEGSTLVLVEPFWEPKIHHMIHKLGQRKECIVYRLIMKDTIEEVLKDITPRDDLKIPTKYIGALINHIYSRSSSEDTN